MKTKTFRLHWLDGSIEEIRGPTKQDGWYC